MTIKHNLEKVYDKLSWTFNIDSSKHKGMSSHFINIIWHYISLVFMSILCNGEYSSDLRPSIGIQ